MHACRLLRAAMCIYNYNTGENYRSSWSVDGKRWVVVISTKRLKT